MSRALPMVLLVAVALAGCLGSPVADTASDGETVEYVVRPGPVAEGVEQVTVDFAVYFAERPGDVYPCTDDAPLYDSEYDPTPTPLPTATGECEAVDVDPVDVAALDGPTSLGEFAPAHGGGHTLVVHDVTVVLENGTTVSDVHDTDFRAVTERSTPSGTYGVEIGVTDRAETDSSVGWRYGITNERYDPAGE